MKRLNFKLIERRKTGTNPNGALKPSEGKGKYQSIISFNF